MTEVNFKEEDVKPKIVKKSNKPIAINSPVKKQQHRIIETDEIIIIISVVKSLSN